MILSRFFKPVKPNRFDYLPRYFDQEKEELKERFRDVRMSEEHADEAVVQRIVKFNKEFEAIRDNSYSFKRRQEKTSRTRFIVILFVLSFLCYWILTRF